MNDPHEPEEPDNDDPLETCPEARTRTDQSHHILLPVVFAIFLGVTLADPVERQMISYAAGGVVGAVLLFFGAVAHVCILFDQERSPED